MSYPAISLATATVGRHRCPQKRLQTARQPPVYPNSSPDHRACNSLTPFRCPHAVHPCPSVDSGLHGRQLAGKPANPTLITLSSLLDMSVITLVVLFWPDPEQRGLASPFFVMYYPAVLAFSFVMRPKFSIAYTLVTLVAYGGACLLTSSYVGVLASAEGTFDAETLVARLVTLGAVGSLGTYYWRIQRDRRRAAATSSGTPAAAR